MIGASAPPAPPPLFLIPPISPITRCSDTPSFINVFHSLIHKLFMIDMEDRCLAPGDGVNYFSFITEFNHKIKILAQYIFNIISFIKENEQNYFVHTWQINLTFYRSRWNGLFLWEGLEFGQRSQRRTHERSQSYSYTFNGGRVLLLLKS